MLAVVVSQCSWNSGRLSLLVLGAGRPRTEHGGTSSSGGLCPGRVDGVSSPCVSVSRCSPRTRFC